MLKRYCAAAVAILMCLQSVGIGQVSGTQGRAALTLGNYCMQNPSDPFCSGNAQGDASQIRVDSESQDATSELPDDSRMRGQQPRETAPYRGGAARNAVVPQEEDTEFQKFVEQSIGRRLPVYGYNLFQSVPTTFAPVDRVPVPADYVIGPGDQLLIRAWGQIDIDARVIVDRNGQIYLPKIGSLTVAGVKYDQLSNNLKTAISRVFRNFDLTVTLGQLRSIQVFVVGYARRPGSYTVSSLSTLVNALFACGGPSLRGSLRRVQLKRGNTVVTEFDLYDLLLRGDKSKDVLLRPGDVIYIPPVGSQVALTGSVNLPGIYELRGRETLSSELNFAGGLSSVADGQRVIVERIEGRSTRKVEEFRLDETGLKHELHDGDLVRVFSISPRFENAVILRGNVADPGRYPFRPGMKIRDLIPNREFLLTRNFWNHQNAKGAVNERESGEYRAGNSLGENVRLGVMGQDLSVQQSESLVGSTDLNDVALGRVPSSESYGRSESEGNGTGSELRSTRIRGQADLRNDVKLSAPEINWDYAVVQRINPTDLSTNLIAFDLGKAILDGDDAANVELQAGDVITIFSQNDIAVSQEHRSKIVRLEGEFRAPGVYKVRPGETLRSLIARAGGLTDGAYLFGTQLTRESARKQQQVSLEQMTSDLELEAQHEALFASKARSDQQLNVQAQLESQRALIEKLKQIQATGRVVLEIMPTQAGIDAIPEIALEDGDTVIVPHMPSIVSVVGAVYNQNSFLFHERARVNDYLKLAGSGNRDSDMKHAFVIRADGSVLSRRSVSGRWSGGLEGVRILPGDTIVVPAQLDKGSTMRAFKDWSQLFSQLALGAAAINVLR